MNVSLEDFRRLEARVALLEERLGIEQEKKEHVEDEQESPAEKSVGLEFRIGEYWLAQVGALMLLFGAAFFISYPLAGVPAPLVSILGYGAVAGLAAISLYWKNSLPHLAKILFGGSLMLLYFATLRLHFFNDTPLLTNRAIAIAAVCLVLAIGFYIAIKQDRKLLTAIFGILAFLSALFFDNPELALGIVVVISGAALLLMAKKGWTAHVFLTMGAAYLTHLLVLFNNPVMGHPVQQILTHHYNVIFLIIYASVFSVAGLLQAKRTKSYFIDTAFTVLNAGGITIIMLLNGLVYFKSQAVWLALFLWLYFIILAVINWLQLRENAATAFYSIFGYLALSTAILIHYSAPNYFIWLGLQSLFVIVTALWFHSRIIIVSNSLILMGILVAYLFFAESSNSVNLILALVTLASARILNWKRERLSLKTDLIRNMYLGLAFIMVLYGLYHAFPAKLTSIAWLGAALFYMGLSILLKNVKYRYLAILTVVATIIHVFIVDAANLTAGFRIILFISVGIMILLFSMIYSKLRVRSLQESKED